MEIEKKIKKIIKKSDNIFVQGHKNLDLDAIGACVGITSIANHFNKDSYIIVDDEIHELGVEKILSEIKGTKNIIKSDEIPEYFMKNSVLVIVDVSKAHLLQNQQVLHSFNQIIVLDHHQVTEQTINATSIIDDRYSSACEIVANLIETYRIKPSKEDATIILSGIVLDTNNFKVKTSSNTYYSAYFLSKYGADSKKIKYYLKENLNDYIIRNKVVMNTEIINGKYAVAKALENTKYKREELAKMADTLLSFHGVEASFIIGERQDEGIGVSARSEGKVDVGKITETLGGGGDISSAACQLFDTTISKVYEELKEVLNKEE